MRKGCVKEVLSRIKYDDRLNESNYLIEVEWRSRNGDKTKVLHVSEIELGHGYFYIGEEAQVPYHRVLRVMRKDGAIIWETHKYNRS